MSKKNAEVDRKVRVEQMRKAQQAAERRRTFLVVGSAVAVVAVLIAVVGVVVWQQMQDRNVGRVGVAMSAAQCDPEIEDPTTGSSVHVGPGTDQEDKTKIEYAQVPPSSGEHYQSPEYPSRAFYTADDRPAMESLVHNLEHGYTVVWYDPQLPAEQIEELERIAELTRAYEAMSDKFIVSAWDSEYGKLPEGKKMAMSHWGKDKGFRQFCGAVSGEAVKTFVEKHPATDSPEPNGA